MKVPSFGGGFYGFFGFLYFASGGFGYDWNADDADGADSHGFFLKFSANSGKNP